MVENIDEPNQYHAMYTFAAEAIFIITKAIKASS